MLELRRRIQADPASIAFAQLAEECRRQGSNEEAVEICRAGLARNPGYLSARITLGRALIELGDLDAAKAELDIVVAGVPDNLAAIRGLAEILQRRGQMTEALQYYRRALELARHDPDLEDTVERISQEVAPAPPQHAAGPQASIEEIFNFDKLIDQLGLSASAVDDGFGATAPEPPPVSASAAEGGPVPSLEELFADAGAEAKSDDAAIAAFEARVLLEEAALEAEAPVEDFFAEIAPAPATVPSEGGLASVVLTLDDSDSLAIMERELRELEHQRERERQRAHEDEQRALEQQRALERQLELERQRVHEEQLRELERQRALEQQRVLEEQQRALERQLELERQRWREEQQRAIEEQLELERQQRAYEDQQRTVEEQRALEQQRALEEQQALDRQGALEVQKELEQQREFERQRADDEQSARVALAQRRRAAQIGALENWLSAIVADRERHSA